MSVVYTTNEEPVAVDPKVDKIEPKVVSSEEKVVKVAPEADEDENGLTPAEKAELTRKMQRAIGKKHAKLKDTEEYAAEQLSARRAAEARSAAYEKELAELRAKVAPKEEPKGPPRQPSRAEFDTEEAYSAAWYKWQDDVVAHKVQETLAKERREIAQKDAAKALDAKIDAARGAKDDFDDVVQSFTKPFPSHVEGYIQESDMLGELLYHLGSNPDELARIESLSPAKALVALARIESKLPSFATPVAKAPPSRPAKAASTGDEPENSTPVRASKESRAPILTPVPTDSDAQVTPETRSVREEIEHWRKRRDEGHHLFKRKRH